jgi:hypothetical protein
MDSGFNFARITVGETKCFPPLTANRSAEIRPVGLLLNCASERSAFAVFARLVTVSLLARTRCFRRHHGRARGLENRRGTDFRMSQDLSCVTNEVLVSSLHALARASNSVEADLIAHLAELDARKLYRDQGHSSLFRMCEVELGFSADMTCNRTAVARLAQRLPQVLVSLRQGDVHLTALRLLAPHLNDSNVDVLLARAHRKSTRQIEELVAELAPKPNVPDSVRKTPQRVFPATTNVPLLELQPALVAAPHTSVPPSVPETATFAPDLVSTAPPRKSKVAPLSAETYEVKFTAHRALKEKLDEARALLRHSLPQGDLAPIIDQALDLLIAKVKKERFGVGAKPRVKKTVEPENVSDREVSSSESRTEESKPAPRQVSRHIPKSFRRAIFERDEGQCTFVSAEGERCGEKSWLEFDHLDGFARTGEHSVERITLRCRVHNLLGAERLYGRDFMDAARQGIRFETDNPGAESDTNLAWDWRRSPGPGH